MSKRVFGVSERALQVRRGRGDNCGPSPTGLLWWPAALHSLRPRPGYSDHSRLILDLFTFLTDFENRRFCVGPVCLSAIISRLDETSLTLFSLLKYFIGRNKN